ncbi:Uncharacterised protein [Vibrio cholerae]|nr:Uncharacterised protein [Vibrio cholerae]
MLHVLPQHRDGTQLVLTLRIRAFARPCPSTVQTLQNRELGFVIVHQLHVFTRSSRANRGE